MDQPHPASRPVPAEWLDAMAEGEADLAAGRTVSAEAVLTELETANARMMARRTRKASQAT